MTLLYVDESSIDKGLFCKIIPRMYAAYSTHSGNVRVVGTSEFVEDIEFDRYDSITAVRKFTLAELSANGHWFWDRANSNIYFYYSGSRQYIVVKIGIFVTTTFDILAKSSLGSTTVLEKTIYENRMQETSFTQSCEDILSGKFGISTTNISLINNDSRYNKYATDTYSFKNAEIKVWLVINDILTNYSLIFNGLCQSVSFSGSEMLLDVIEFTKALQQEATFNDTTLWSTINRTTWAACKEDETGYIIPFFLSGGSKKTAKKTKSIYYYIDGGTLENVNVSKYDFYDVDSETDFKLKYVANESPGAYPGGKKYVVCRMKNGEFPQNFHWFVDKSTTPVLIDAIANADITVSKSISMGTNGYRYAEYSIEAKSTNINRLEYLYPGMNVYLRNTTSGMYYNMIVTFVDTTFNIFGVRFFAGAHITNIKVTSNNYQLHYRGPTVYTIVDGVPCFLPWDNFYFAYETTDGGNYMVYCVVTPEVGSESYEYTTGETVKAFRLFTDDFGWSATDVPDLEYYCRFLSFKIVSDMSTYTIGKVLNTTARLVKGITTDSASDTLVAGNSYYDFHTKIGTDKYIDIVANDGKSNESYLDILEKILASTMSFMCINTAGQLIVRLFENEPYGSILLELTEDDIKDKSVTSDFDASEIASQIFANPEYSLDQAVISNSDRTRRLIGDVKFNYKHLLKTSTLYTAKVKDRLEAYKLDPIKKYTFTIINKGYELTLGDRISIRLDNSGKWLGSDTTKSLFIIKLNKALSGVVVTCIENIFP
jgi:hypothetical protein